MNVSKKVVLVILEIILLISLLVRLFTFGIYIPDVSLVNNLLGILIAILVFVPLVFIAVIDLFDMEIPNRTSLCVLIVLLLLNIVTYFVVTGIGPDAVANIFGIIIRPIENMKLALVMGTFSFLTVYLSKEKLMGEGDIRMFIIAGLIVGMDKALQFLYVMAFGGLLYGFFVGIRQKKMSGVRVPLGTFIVLSAIVTFLFL